MATYFLLLLTFGKISGLNFSYGENGFQAGFGTIEQGLNADAINDLIRADREDFMNVVRHNIESVQDSISNDFKVIVASLGNNEVDNPESLVLTDEDVNRMLDDQKQDIMNQMAQLSEKLTDDYRDIFKGLYDSFSDGIRTERNDDLRNIQAAFTTLENAALNNQEKVDEALFNLSQEVNALIAQNNNNNNNN